MNIYYHLCYTDLEEAYEVTSKLLNDLCAIQQEIIDRNMEEKKNTLEWERRGLSDEDLPFMLE